MLCHEDTEEAQQKSSLALDKKCQSFYGYFNLLWKNCQNPLNRWLDMPWSSSWNGECYTQYAPLLLWIKPQSCDSLFCNLLCT